MLKKRIVGVVSIKDGWTVQSLGFSRFLPLGRPEIAVEFLNDWGADEIMVVDIDASKTGRSLDPRLIEKLSKKAFTPLTVAGGLQNIDQVKAVLRSGADKVGIGAAFRKNPDFIAEIAHSFGRQCVVGIVDYKKTAQGYRVYDHVARQLLTDEALDYAVKLSAHSGEILFNSVDADGSKRGFDVSFLKTAAARLPLPVIALGGAGQSEHFKTLFQETNVHAAAAANLLAFSEHSVSTLKGFLSQSSPAKIRFSRESPYALSDVDNLGRPLPRTKGGGL